MAIRKPSATLTRTYLYLKGGRFPALVRHVDKTTGTDLKHEASSLEEASKWMKDSGSRIRQQRRNDRRQSKAASKKDRG